MKKKILLFISVAMLATTCLFGCANGGRESTLESYYSQPQMKAAMDEQMEQQKESLKNMYSDINIDFVGNEIIYTYTTVASLDDSINEDSLDSQLKGMSENLINTIRNEAGVAEDTPVTITFKYNKSTGEEIAICSYTIPEAEGEAETEEAPAEDAAETEEAPAEDAAETVEE